MPKSVNRIILMGHLGRDAESKTRNDNLVVWLNLATTEWQKVAGTDQYSDRTIWSRISCAGKLADKAVSLHKGDYVYVEGSLSCYEYEDASGSRQTLSYIKARDVIPWVPKERKQDSGPTQPPLEEVPF